MKKEAYDFVTNLVNTSELGSKISRAQIVQHMIAVYKPEPKDTKTNSSFRTAIAVVLREFVSNGILKRVDRGIYEIIKKPNG